MPKKEGAWTVFRFKEDLTRKRGVVFLKGEGGFDTLMNTMEKFGDVLVEKKVTLS